MTTNNDLNNYASLSPFLNFNPNIINDDYIYLDGSNKPTRGKFEYAFSRIGLSFLTGGAIGWVNGGYNGLKFTQKDLLQNSVQNTITNSWNIRRSHILNFMVKTGVNTANTFGIIAFTYSVINLGMSYVLEQDNYNTLITASSTGFIYRYLSNPKPRTNNLGQNIQKILTKKNRLKRGGIGGAFGILAGIAIILFTNDNKFLKSPQSNFFKY